MAARMHLNGCVNITRRQALWTAAAAMMSLASERGAFAAAQRRLTNGVDVSWLPAVEAAGAQYFDAQGHRIDPIKLLKANGVRVGRIRVFVNPADENSTIASAIALSHRLVKSGLQVCLDLHFSDTWADPAHQLVPTAWAGLDLAGLTQQVSDYTEACLKRFVHAGVRPTWIQLGNEITNGFLWPLGRISSDSAEQWESFTQLHNAATDAMHSVLPHATSILHLDCGGDASRVDWWLSNSLKHGVRGVDIVGVSYYSQWGGPLKQLAATLEVASGKYGKRVLVAETAYPWTHRTYGNDVLDVSKAELDAFPLTKSGQAAYLHAVQSIVRKLPNQRGVGVWWWEGFATRVIDADGFVLWNGGMANAALVTPYGCALPALKELGR
jgi:arabinogalactan endo-1,4-beta-galactosidase